MSITKKSIVIDQKGQSDSSVKRRAFLKYSGVSIATSAFILSGCEDVALTPDRNNNAAARAAGEGEVDLGSGDIGILNYAYALEQLEAAFYTTVVASSGFASMYTDEERMILKDLKDHEIVHREFFRTALGENAIKDLEVDFSAIDFNDKSSVLGTAKVFEDLGVAAYNGAGKLLKDVNLLLVAGKIVSVEARHAAAIRDVLNPWSSDFAGDDVVDENGLDVALMPADVLEAAQPFIKDKINGSNLPTS